jgi:hypothetical protein
MMKDKYDSDKANNRLPEGFTGEWKKDYIQYLEFHNQNKEESCPADVKKENEENKVVWYGNK